MRRSCDWRQASPEAGRNMQSNSAFQSSGLPPLLQAEARRRAKALALHALALDPHQGLAYTAIGVVTQDTASWLDNERLVQRALLADPRSPEAHNWQSGQLSAIGQLQKGLSEAKLSYQLDHFLPGKTDQLVGFYTELGELDDAQDELELARRNWPGYWWWDEDAVALGIAGSKPDRALAYLLTSNQVRMEASRKQALEAFLRWRIAATPSNQAAAIRAIEAAAKQGAPTNEEVQLLAKLGQLDGAYRLAARLPSATTFGDGWWGPDLASFRADRRFMPFAAKIGLAKTWLETGLWPDFCMAPAKLASCKAAAAAAVGDRQAPS